MDFAHATKSFWSNYAASLRVLFSGRSRRSEYWFIQLFLVLTNLAAAVIDLVLLGGDFDQFLANGGGGIVGLIWILITIVPAIGVWYTPQALPGLVPLLPLISNAKAIATLMEATYWPGTTKKINSKKQGKRGPGKL